MIGRKPESTQALELRKGKLYDKQAARAEYEPRQVLAMEMRCPRGFSKQEKKEWKYWSSIFSAYGLMIPANMQHLKMLCTYTAELAEYNERARNRPVIKTRKRGEDSWEWNPYWTARNRLNELIMKILSECGVSSTGLAKLGSLMVKAKKEEGIQSLFDGG